MPAMMALPAFDNDVIKKLRKRKINSVAGACLTRVDGI
jgi:hypothetical protein